MPGQAECGECNGKGRAEKTCGDQKKMKKCCSGSGGRKDDVKHPPRPKRMSVYKPPEDVSLKRVVSRELRSSVLYIDCDCYHRNGLQDDCPRHKCSIDRKKCMVQPWPTCELGKYYREKWAKQEAARKKPAGKQICVPFNFDLTPRYDDEHKCPDSKDVEKNKKSGCGGGCEDRKKGSSSSLEAISKHCHSSDDVHKHGGHHKTKCEMCCGEESACRDDLMKQKFKDCAGAKEKNKKSKQHCCDKKKPAERPCGHTEKFTFG